MNISREKLSRYNSATASQVSSIIASEIAEINIFGGVVTDLEKLLTPR